MKFVMMCKLEKWIFEKTGEGLEGVFQVLKVVNEKQRLGKENAAPVVPVSVRPQLQGVRAEPKKEEKVADIVQVKKEDKKKDELRSEREERKRKEEKRKSLSGFKPLNTMDKKTPMKRKIIVSVQLFFSRFLG